MGSRKTDSMLTLFVSHKVTHEFAFIAIRLVGGSTEGMFKAAIPISITVSNFS